MVGASLPFARWFAVLVMFLLLGAAGAVQGAAPVPRYRFEPGQELRYSGQLEGELGSGQKLRLNVTWHVWVVRQNDDGGWRLILRYGSQPTDPPVRPRPGRGQESVQLAWCDFSPQGRAIGNEAFVRLVANDELLTLLPDDERAAEASWTELWPTLNMSNRCRLLADQSTAEVAVLETVREGFIADVYGTSVTRKVSFNLRRGLPEKIDRTVTCASPQDGHSSSTLKLDEVVLHDAAWCREFAAGAERYFAGADAYYLPMRDPSLSSPELKSGLEKVVMSLRQLRSELGGSIFEPAVGEILGNHGHPGGEIYEGNYLNSARKRESLVGRRAADWTCPDFEGREHSLQDYRGRVVLLDFWFRDCYWCVQSMPQLKEIAAHFERQPVTLLGMNEDEEAEVAQRAIKNAKLNYLNLQARGIAREYQSPGSPGLVIIDQSGIICDVHIGYSKDLKQRVVKSVEELLKKTP